MIVSVFIYVAEFFLYLIAAIMPSSSFLPLPGAVSSGIESLANYAWGLNAILPVSLIFYFIGLWFLIDLTIFGIRSVVWVVKLAFNRS